MDRQERQRLKKMFNSKRSRYRGKWKFKNANDFIDWWEKTLSDQEEKCAYCETSIVAIKKLIADKKIGYRRANKTGLRDELELERRNPDGDYSPENCVLVCCYCNNDKSNVYKDADAYKRFFGAARKKHFGWLARQ
jgi:hypothetical protein